MFFIGHFARVSLVDVLQREHCGGRMKILAAIRPPTATEKILECLGLPSRAPPLATAFPTTIANRTPSERRRQDAAGYVCLREVDM